MDNYIGILPTKARSSLRAAGKTLTLGALSLIPSATRLRHIDLSELRYGNVTVHSYTSGGTGFPVVVLHGLTHEGFDDSRLVRFCRILAAAGFCVYAPNLRGLCTMDPDPTEIDSITALLTTLVKEHKSQIGLMGFSFGGSYALLSSACPEIAGSVRFVLAVGAYYSLADVVGRVFTMRGKRDLSPEEAYALLALDWRYRTMLPLTERETTAAKVLMVRTCSRAMQFTGEEMALVGKIASLPQQEDIYAEWRNRLRTISRLNIEDNSALESLEASVFLLHSERDTSIPVEESSRIATNLARLHKNVLSHIGRFGDHVTFSIRNDAGLAHFFYRLMLLTELRDTGIPSRNGRRGSSAK